MGREFFDPARTLIAVNLFKNKEQSPRAKHMRANCLRDDCRAVIDKWEAKRSNLGELGGGFLEVRQILKPLENNQVLLILSFCIEPT
jgi:hypothetical protein